jgi:hypothetical protein
LATTHSLVSGDTYGVALVDLPLAQRERRREEGGARLVGGQVLDGGADPADHAGVFRPVTVDEARLADAGGEQLLQVAERPVHLVEHRPARADLGRPTAREVVEVPERRVVGGQQIDRLGAREVVLQQLDLGAGGVGQRAVQPRHGVAVRRHPAADPHGQQADPDQQHRQRETTHPKVPVSTTPPCRLV